jgi:hypothetical protein
MNLGGADGIVPVLAAQRDSANLLVPIEVLGTTPASSGESVPRLGAANIPDLCITRVLICQQFCEGIQQRSTARLGLSRLVAE